MRTKDSIEVTLILVVLGLLKYYNQPVLDFICVAGFFYVGKTVLEVSERLRSSYIQREQQIKLMQSLLEK